MHRTNYSSPRFALPRFFFRWEQLGSTGTFQHPKIQACTAVKLFFAAGTKERSPLLLWCCSSVGLGRMFVYITSD